jgi:hypothetical protein
MTFPSQVPAPPARRGLPGWAIALIAVGSLFVLGFCVIVVIGVLTLLGGRVDAPLRSDDGSIQVTAPGTWKQIPDLNDQADLQVGYARQEQYLIVLTENQVDLVDIDLEAYSDMVLEQMPSVIESSETSAARIMQINGRPAIQYEISGTVDNIKVVYWLTSVEGEKNFHQILAWTLDSKAETNRPIMLKVIESFAEVKT